MSTSNIIVLASGNSKKIAELQALLTPFAIQIKPQADFAVSEVAETGTTFVENAIIKARHATKQTGLPAIADDSGIEVDALAGKPGVYSARFAGNNATDDANNQLLIEKLNNIAAANRTARYHAVLVYMKHQDDPTPIICHGSWEGIIQLEPKGQNGFGYDPYFYLTEFNCTAAELEPEVKNKISHRGLAMQKLLSKLQAIYQQN